MSMSNDVKAYMEDLVKTYNELGKDKIESLEIISDCLEQFDELTENDLENLFWGNKNMVYVRLFNSMGIMVDELEVKEDESIMYAISESLWCLQHGDTIKIVDAEEE